MWVASFAKQVQTKLMPDDDASTVPPILRCERCGRYCMSLELHIAFCAEEPDTKKGDARRRAPLPLLPQDQPKSNPWEEEPATASLTSNSASLTSN